MSRDTEWLVTEVGGETVRAFVPADLPPAPSLDMTRLYLPLEEASAALGRLDGIATVLPGTPLFIYMYVRKEALLSAQIEGTQSSLSDLLAHEDQDLPGAPLDDVVEVSNYVGAMEFGLKRMESLPLSLRLIREIHEQLMSSGRGSLLEPGSFRTSQNWIGGTRPGNAVYAPPPPDQMQRSLNNLELFLHEQESGLPLLIRAGLAHVQFESIHPFLDGNGRLGRLLITLLLCSRGALSQPLLYLSLYLKTHRERYYELLQHVRTTGDWESWLDFFLTGVRDTSTQAAGAAREIIELFENDRRNIATLGRKAASQLRVHELLQSKPSVSVGAAARALELTEPTIRTALDRLEALGIVLEATGKKRGKRYTYARYLDILTEGTEPL